MLNNIIVPVCCYLYQVDPVNLRPKNFTFFVFSNFRLPAIASATAGVFVIIISVLDSDILNLKIIIRK
jgi:hypothetical protein